MELKKVQKVTETTQVKVLTISEKEFEEIATEVMKSTLQKDKEHVGDPMIHIALTISYGLLMAQLHNRLFKQEETKE